LRMSFPRTVAEALHELSDAQTIAVAGATWVLRAPLRQEPLSARFIALNKVDVLGRFDVAPGAISIGAMVTHDQLARSLPKAMCLEALRNAAAHAANPGVRRFATIGGNISAYDFSASDFAAALISLDATVQIAQASGERLMPVSEFLAQRKALQRPWLVTTITVPVDLARASAHVRLPMRRAGDYPSAILSASASPQGQWRIGVSAVEDQPRRWHELECALQGVSPAQAEEAARELAGAFLGRDTPGTPGWYRTSVLPVLVRRAASAIEAQLGRP